MHSLSTLKFCTKLLLFPQAGNLAIFWTSPSIDSEANHQEIASKNLLVQLSSPAEVSQIMALRVYGSCVLQEEFSYEILRQKYYILLPVPLQVLDPLASPGIFALLSFLRNLLCLLI